MTDTPKIKLFNGRHATVLCAGALLLSLIINFAFDSESLLSIARRGDPPFTQLVTGAFIGACLALLGLGALTGGTRYFRRIALLRDQMLALFRRVDVSGVNPLIIGVSAGLWEEVLFRAALQPIAGIWLGSVVFTLCHTGTGQFWAMNWSKGIYAVGVFAAGVFLGSVFVYFGLIAAIATHATIDVVGLFAMRYLWPALSTVPKCV